MTDAKELYFCGGCWNYTLSCEKIYTVGKYTGIETDAYLVNFSHNFINP